MARPTDRSKHQSTVPLFVPEGMVAKEIKLEPIEDNLERKHRIWKDKISFLVNDILASFIAFAVLIGIITYSIWSLTRPDLTKEDKQFAISILTSAGTAVVGFVFGKAKK
jgi:Sec-independent protein secretion pathway component TatC